MDTPKRNYIEPFLLMDIKSPDLTQNIYDDRCPFLFVFRPNKFVLI